MAYKKASKRWSLGSKSTSSPNINEKIQKKAYELWEKRGYSHGHDWNDWFVAEKLVKARKR